MKIDFSMLWKTMFQIGIGLFMFILLLLLFFLLRLLIEQVFKITIPLNKDDLNLVLVIVATIGAVLYVHNKSKSEKEKDDEKKQIDLLKVLIIELNFLEDNLKSYKKTFSKQYYYPFYELWDINVAIYLNGLNHKLNEQDTIELKKNLMIIKDKLLIINNMKHESKEEEKREREWKIKIKIESLREGIINIINDDLLPVIKKSKEFIKKQIQN